MSKDAELDIANLIEGFEHEFDVCTEKLKIVKPIFDGRLGDPALALKMNLARYVKHHASRLVASEIQKARIDELGSLIPNFDGVGNIGYQYADGSRVSTDVRIKHLENQLSPQAERKTS